MPQEGEFTLPALPYIICIAVHTTFNPFLNVLAQSWPEKQQSHAKEHLVFVHMAYADLCSASRFTVVRIRISPTHALLLLPCADVVFCFEKKDSFHTS